jgi:hypothetical protein
MDSHPSDQSQVVAEHKPKRSLRIVVIAVIILVVAIGLVIYLHRPTTGTVTAFNTTSITIKPNGSSATKTYNITNNTMVGLPKSSSDYGVPQQYNIKYFHIGETVVINVDSNNQAQAITVNP